MKPAYIKTWLTGLLLLSGFFCTIREDNGQPGISGPNKIEETDENLVLVISAESTYVRLKTQSPYWPGFIQTALKPALLHHLKTSGSMPVQITANSQMKYFIQMKKGGQDFFLPTLSPKG